MIRKNIKLVVMLLALTILLSAGTLVAQSNHGAGAINPATGQYYKKQVGVTPVPTNFKGQDGPTTKDINIISTPSSSVRGVVNNNNKIVTWISGIFIIIFSLFTLTLKRK